MTRHKQSPLPNDGFHAMMTAKKAAYHAAGKDGNNTVMEFLGSDIKKLGFGLMRLPQSGEVIDIEQVKDMVDRFLAEGYTYFDTAWAYPGSEDAIRRALVERYPRDRFQLATKNAAWIGCKTREDAIRQFETSLKQTGAGYFDYYLLHNLGESRTRFFDDFDLWGFVQEEKQKGRIRHVGFSFHSTPQELEELLVKHPEMEFVQLQINYADWENAAICSRACYEIARRHGKPVIIMEPVKGGMLASPPPTVEAVFRQANPNLSCACWAIRFAADLEGVITVLSGMSSREQMEDNLACLQEFSHLSPEERQTLKKAQEELNKIPLIPCTTCNYCSSVCPIDVGISGSFTAMNCLTLYQDVDRAKWQGSWLVGGHGKKSAKDCTQCGECEKVCPQHILISEELVKVDQALGDLSS